MSTVERKIRIPALVRGPRVVRVALAGCGTVGGELVRLVAHGADEIRARHGVRLELASVLVRHAEALLFIHDQQAELFPADVLGQHPMGADDDIATAVFERADHPGLFGFRDEAREHLDAQRVVVHALFEGVEVLLC